MTSLSYGRIFCLESQKIDGTYQRYNHSFNFFYLNCTFLNLKFDFSLLIIKIEIGKKKTLRGKATLPL